MCRRSRCCARAEIGALAVVVAHCRLDGLSGAYGCLPAPAPGRVGALLPGLFVPLQPVAFLSRVACLVEAIFLGAPPRLTGVTGAVPA